MNDCQGRGQVTRLGEHVATVEYSVQSEPDVVHNSTHGHMEIVEGERSLSTSDKFTLHMEGDLDIDFQIAEVINQSEGKYQIRGIGVFRRSSRMTAGHPKHSPW